MESKWKFLASVLVLTIVILSLLAIYAQEVGKIWNSDIETSLFEDSTSNEYIFIEYHIDIHVEVIEGDYRGQIIDSPTYTFEEDSGILRGMIFFDINDTLKAIYGRDLRISGVGGGRENRLYGVYELPYQHLEFSILQIDGDGAVHLNFRNSSITLESGKEWMNVTSKIDTERYNDERSIAEITLTEKIVNHGFLSRSKIEK